MPDNFTANPGSGGATFASDDIGGIQWPRVKVGFGVDGVATDVSAADPLPVSVLNFPASQAVTGPLTDAQLRASAVPVSRPDTTASGTIVAINDTLSVSCAGRNTVTIQVEGTYTGFLAGQARVNTTGAWVTLSATTTMLNAATGVYSATIPSDAQGIWHVDVSGFAEFRLIALAAVTGTATVNMRASDAQTLVSLDAPLPASTNAIGDVGIQYRANATGAASISQLIAGASTNATVVKASAGRLLGFVVTNNATAVRYLKFHNQATSPTAGTGVVQTYGIPPNGGTVAISIPGGVAFSTGIALTTVTGPTAADTTAVAANDLVGTIHFA